MVEEVWHPVIVARAGKAYLLPPRTRKEQQGMGFLVSMVEEDAPKAVGQMVVSAVEFECVDGDWFPIGDRRKHLGQLTIGGVWHAGPV